MESILNMLNSQEVWQEYLEYKSEKGRLAKKEQENLADFIEQKKYESVVRNILNSGPMSIPEKKLINKVGGNKRVVYSFSEDENTVLKLLSYLLYCYDDQLPPACYSFRKGFSVHKAIYKIINTPGISGMWSYKLDIRNYFNSISVPVLLPILEQITSDDPMLFQFFSRMLSVNTACFENEIIQENRGAMAGTPTSPFLANIYLKELDSYFTNRGVLYARYSDDIIVFARSEEELTEYRDILYQFLNKYKLTVNEKKEKISKPAEAWEYLGVEYKNGRTDLSSSTKQKLKGKIRRKARALHRWKLRKNAGDEQTMRVMVRSFNKKFYENDNPHELTWSRWFFPVVTEKTGFEEIDAYLQQYIRYISTGCHSKKNYRITYRMIKEMGYRSLVNEYYKYRADKLLPAE